MGIAGKPADRSLFNRCSERSLRGYSEADLFEVLPSRSEMALENGKLAESVGVREIVLRPFAHFSRWCQLLRILRESLLILEKDGIPVIGILDADELENYLELRDRKVAATIWHSTADVRAGRVRPADSLVNPSKPEGRKSTSRRS